MSLNDVLVLAHMAMPGASPMSVSSTFDTQKKQKRRIYNSSTPYGQVELLNEKMVH